MSRKIHTRSDNILPRMPRDGSSDEQKIFNEAVLKSMKKLMRTASTDLRKLEGTTNDTEADE